jgi:hypothetical protein
MVGEVLISSAEPATSLLLTAQNDCPRTLLVKAFSVTVGSWDTNPEYVPVVGQEVTPATTGCWKTISPNVLAGLQGSLSLLLAQVGGLSVTWALNPEQPFSPVLTKTNWPVTNIDASLVTNVGDGVHVWVQLIVATVVSARKQERLAALAARFGADVSTMARVNGLHADTALREGQRVLLVSHLPEPTLFWSNLAGWTGDDPAEGE